MEKITDKISALPENATFFSLEFFPPKTQMGLSNLQARLERMSRALRPLFVNVTWGAGGSTSTKSLELADLCQRQLGLTTCLHLTCTNMSRKLVDSALEQAQALGIRNILALRGDPPRSEEYGLQQQQQPQQQKQQQLNGIAHDVGDDKLEDDMDSNADFNWAIDLVRHIRRKYGDFFCIGVAAYPEGHSDQSHPDDQDPKFDLPFLREKTKAGADFIMTQLFYDIDAYRDFEKMLRTDASGVFETIPIIPGLMPIQSYQIIKRVTKLSHAKVPPHLMTRLDAVKGDDEEVKQVGVEILSEIVEALTTSDATGRRGFHFYTLNLEKAVSQIVERCHLIPDLWTLDSESALEISDDTLAPPHDKSKERRKLSSANSTPSNRVIVESTSPSSKKHYEALAVEAGIPSDKLSSRANTLAISEGEGSLGREATWDDFPNGRWGDARSPAFGEIDGYGVSLHVSASEAFQFWGYPTTTNDISDIFQRHIGGKLDLIPWSEEPLNEETTTISEELLKLNAKGWWTVASQPAVNGIRSSDPVFGWGPKNGFIFQKPFVEYFLPQADWKQLQEKLDKHPEVTYFAGNSNGSFISSDYDAVNPVTWGTFPGKEIITPTIIESVSFRAWIEEAFSIWGEWQRLYAPRSVSAKLLGQVRQDYWLVNIVCHDYMKKDALWHILLE